MLHSLRTLVTSLAIASTVGSVAQAYASSTTAQTPSRTQVTTAGISVSAVDYEVASSYLRAVTFHSDTSSASISIRLRQDGDWIPCSNDSGAIRCEMPSYYPVSALEKLEVTAS